MGTCQRREKSLAEKYRSSRIAEGYRKVGYQPRKIICPEIPKEVQGPHRTVEQKNMMMMIEYIIK
jgi:hypothetical protein